MCPMKQINSDDRVVQTIQTNAAQAIASLENGPFINGNKLTAVALTSGQDNLVPHKLGRTLQNWLLIGQNTNSVVWSPSTSSLNNSNANDQFINLRCSTSCTVNLWVS